MRVDGVRVRGAGGQPVLLLPGGAEAVDGFFPGLADGLVAEPGCRVIEYDRPGTGNATEDGTLGDAAAHLGAVIERLGFGPVVVVGQSLGGAVAVLLASAHPEHVAGVVLVDPTPVNDPRLCGRIERMSRVLARLSGVPGVRRLLSAAVRASVVRTVRTQRLRPDCAAALERTAGLDLSTLDLAVRGITGLSRDLRESDLPTLPAVVVTADRKPGAAIRRAHERLAAALGARLECWPGATHSAHLDHPDETLAVVRDVVGRAGV